MQARINTEGTVTIEEVTLHNKLFNRKNNTPVIEEEPIVRTKVFTDGKLVDESPVKEEAIATYSFSNGERLFRMVDTLKTKTLRFKDYSFIITYVLAREPFKVEDTRVMLTNVKDIKVYIKDIKNRKAQKMAKRVIKEIYRQNKRFNKEEQFLTLFQYTFAFNSQNDPIAFNKETQDVYTVKSNEQESHGSR